MLEGRALQKDGSVFYAQVWVSCYQTSAGLRMSVIVWDASEQRREYEELGTPAASGQFPHSDRRRGA